MRPEMVGARAFLKSREKIPGYFFPKIFKPTGGTTFRAHDTPHSLKLIDPPKNAAYNTSPPCMSTFRRNIATDDHHRLANWTNFRSLS